MQWYEIVNREEDLTLVKVIEGEYKVEWNWIGEGYKGDYDPHDPEDQALLRFYCFRKNKGLWEEIDFTSFCTKVVRTTSHERLKELTVPILRALNMYLRPEQYSASKELERQLERCSWMEA